MEDLIRRSDAISRKGVSAWLDNMGYPRLANAVMDEKRFPSANRPQEWIPCSERLPQIGQKVLASTKKTVFTQVFKGYYSDPKRWAWENNRVKEIEAWQPLPKPWKGADNETD